MGWKLVDEESDSWEWEDDEEEEDDSDESNDDSDNDESDDSGDGDGDGDYFDWTDRSTGDADRGYTRDSSPGDDNGRDAYGREFTVDRYESRYDDDEDDDSRDPQRSRSYYDRDYDDDGNEIERAQEREAERVRRQISDDLETQRRELAQRQPPERNDWWQREADDEPPPPSRPPMHADSSEGDAAQVAGARSAPVATDTQPQAVQHQQGPIATVMDSAAKKMLQDELGRERALIESGRAASQEDVPLLRQILADWRKESGRQLPNEQDPRDMWNFRKYSEDWVGVAADRADAAPKLGVQPFRNAVFTAAGQQLERERQQAEQAARQTQAPNPQDVRYPGGSGGTGVVRNVVPPMPPTTAATALADFEDADYMRPPGYTPGGAVERPTGAPERSDAEAAPYIDAEGNRQPALVAQGNFSGRASATEPQVAGMFERALAPSQSVAVAPAQHGPFLNELTPSPEQRARYAPLISQVAATAQERPLDAAAQVLLAMQQPGGGSPVVVQDTGDAPIHLGAAISALVRNPRAPDAQWAVPAVETLARMAFAQEYNQPPTAMPPEYATHWIESWKAGQAPPLAEQLDRQLREVGAWTPSSPLPVNWRAKWGDDITSDFAQARLMRDPTYRAAVDRTITQAEADSICGPIAARALFRAAKGEDVSLRDAIDMARGVGFDPSRGMAGIDSQVKLMQNMGLDAQKTGIDQHLWSQEVSNDRPVIISSGAHYWVATGYNKDNGKFYVGSTGLAAGGKEWLSIPEMDVVSKQILVKAGKPPVGVQGGVITKTSMNQPAAVTPQSGQYNVYQPPAGAINYKDKNATNGVGLGEIEDFATRKAVERGIDPKIANTIWDGEGGLVNPVLRNYGGEPAWGPPQLHVVAEDPNPQFARERAIAQKDPSKGFVGDRFIAATGLHPSDPKAWKLAMEFALDEAAKKKSWKEWHAATKRGISTQGLEKARPLGFSDEALAYAGLR